MVSTNPNMNVDQVIEEDSDISLIGDQPPSRPNKVRARAILACAVIACVAVVAAVVTFVHPNATHQSAGLEDVIGMDEIEVTKHGSKWVKVCDDFNGLADDIKKTFTITKGLSKTVSAKVAQVLAEKLEMSASITSETTSEEKTEITIPVGKRVCVWQEQLSVSTQKNCACASGCKFGDESSPPDFGCPCATGGPGGMSNCMAWDKCFLVPGVSGCNCWTGHLCTCYWVNCDDEQQSLLAYPGRVKQLMVDSDGPCPEP